jgi:hypothetical protein
VKQLVDVQIAGTFRKFSSSSRLILA